LYVREDDVVEVLDEWIASLVDPKALAASQEPDARLATQRSFLLDRLSEIDKSTRRLVLAIESGTDPSAIQPRLRELRTAREAIDQQLATLENGELLTAVEVVVLIEGLGGVVEVLRQATSSEKANIYRGLGLRLRYEPDDNVVVASADLGRVFSRVGGGT
ncbi:MAG: hypothetical protein M3Q68_08480, partial [Actinomycetota bacterium]|nr:hypothetical protein [Actinomycetota bacterium]